MDLTSLEAMDAMEAQEAPEAPADLKLITKEAADLKTEIARLDGQLKVAKEKFEKIADTIKKTLDLMEMDSMRAHGYLFYKENKTSVSMPKDPASKKELFDYLESKGIFLETVSVNSMTLNSLYKSLAEDAAGEGILDFKLPGVDEPVNYVNLKMRKG